MPRTIALLSALFAALAGMPFLAEAASMSVQLREQVARSVVQVQARGCPGGDRVGSGFAFGPDQHVVTALHVISGCQRISVYWEKYGGATQQASIARVLKGADLALLHASGAPGQALAVDRVRPLANAELEALGYYLAVPTMDNKPLRVTFGSSRLADMLPGGVRRELEQSGAIDLNLEIIRLDGHLLPGLSGAPIFDLSGRVVAIGSGGLKSGAASVSWAVPAEHLERLLASADQLNSGGASSHLFSAAVLDDGGNTGGPRGGQGQASAFACGGVQFVYTGVRTLFELSQAHEDLQSIQYLIREAELTDADLAGFRYHTYQPLEGGAAVAVPDWAELQSTGGKTCQALGLGGRLSVDFAGTPVQNLFQAEAAAMQYETAYAQRSQRFWQLFQPYSYIGSVQRPDGLVANRKTFIAMEPAGTASLAAESLLVHQLVGTQHATFTGITGAYWSFNFQAYSYCDSAPMDPACAPFEAEGKLVAQMMLGIFLATAPLI